MRRKDEYHKKVDLFLRQDWLLKKKEELNSLLSSATSSKEKELLFELLERFTFIKQDTFNHLLEEVASEIVNSNFISQKTQIVSLTWDEEADSGQKVLDFIKMKIYENDEWKKAKLVNCVPKSIKQCDKKGFFQIILLDEFIGTGNTLITRIEYLKKNIKENFEIKAMFLAGIDTAIEKVESLGIDIFCPLILKKGISGYYSDDELLLKKQLMLDLESELAKNINEKELNDYTFGYGKAEALFSAEGFLGNTPNSTFPIFWWEKDKRNSKRYTLLHRYEVGF